MHIGKVLVTFLLSCSVQAETNVLMTLTGDQCFTKNSSAMASIYNLSEDAWVGQIKSDKISGDKISSYQTRKLCEKYDCVESSSSEVWLKQNSLQFNEDIEAYLITDRRWEEFQTYFTKGATKTLHSPKMQYLHIGEINEENFVVPFSLQIEQTANVYICEKDTVTESNCYLWAIDACDDSRNAIRKWYPHDSLPNKNKSSRCPSLNVNRWRRYQFQKRGSVLTFLNEENNILEYKSLPVTRLHLFFHTQHSNGVWKLHNFTYYYTTTEGTSQFNLGEVSAGYQCLSLFINQCSECISNITIGFPTPVMTPDIIQMKKEFKTCFNVNRKASMVMIMETQYIPNSPFTRRGYWTFSDVQISTSEEPLRILNPDKAKWAGKCQHLGTNKILETNPDKTDILENWKNCNEAEIGEDCTPYDMVNSKEASKSRKYCQLIDSNGATKTKCYCSIGYEGPKCERVCGGHKYGHGCQKSCKNCQDGCSNDTVYGKCNTDRCTCNFLGEKCDLPLVIFIFNNPPEIIPKIDSCSLTMKSFEGTGRKSEMTKYVYQYKLRNATKWSNFPQGFVDFGRSDSVELKPLRPDTVYQLRVIGFVNMTNLTEICDSSDNLKPSKIPVYEFETACKAIGREDIDIHPTNESVKIYIKSNVKTKGDLQICKLNNYKITVNGTIMDKKDEGVYSAYKLQPYTQYLVRVSNGQLHLFNTTFRTLESEPTKPYNLNVSWTENNYLIFEWCHPKQTGGILTNFDISIDNSSFLSYHIYSEKDYRPLYFIEIRENVPLAKNYDVSVRACNLNHSSEWESLPVVSPPPIPQNIIDNISRDNNSIVVSFKSIDYKTNFEKYLYILFSTDPRNHDHALQNAIARLRKHHQTYNTLMPAFSPGNWKVIFSRLYDNLTTLTISNTSKEASYKIERSKEYSIAFVWIHKYAGYIRSTYSVEVIHVDGFKRIAWLVIIVIIIIILCIAVYAVCRKKTRYTPAVVYKAEPSAEACPAVVYQAEPSAEASVSEKDMVSHEYIPLPQVKRSRCSLAQFNQADICPKCPLFRTSHSKKVDCDDFADYVKEAIENMRLKKEFEILTQGNWFNRPETLMDRSANQNQIVGICNKTSSGSLNVKFISGYRHPRAYAVVDTPTKETSTNFWEIVWQARINWIAVVNDKESPEKYWPDFDNPQLNFGPYSITHLTCQKMYTDLECRRFLLQFNNQSREILHLYFQHKSDDQMVPLYSFRLTPLVRKVLSLRHVDFPLLLHGSSENTIGLIILCDICLRMAVRESHVNVQSSLEYLNSQQPNMLSSEEQYRLAHLVILDCLNGPQTNIPITPSFKKTLKLLQNFEEQLHWLNECQWQDGAVHCTEYYTVIVDFSKNRFRSILPESNAQVFLESYQDHSTYINAVMVNGLTNNHRFIVTQYPLSNTVVDFWRMVAEQEVRLVVCLNEKTNHSCPKFWPTNNTEKLLNTRSSLVQLRHIKTEEFPRFHLMTMELSATYKNQPAAQVEIMHFSDWEHSSPHPDSATDFAAFVNDVKRKGIGKILVTCYDGARASGLFVASFLLLEQIEREEAIDVFQVVRRIRTSRKQFVTSKVQLEFLYQTAISYIEQHYFDYSEIERGPIT